jgi:hypothetical protein
MDGGTLGLGGKQYHQTATPADILRMIEPLGVLLAHHHGLELVNLVVDFHMFVKHRLDFSFVFSAPLPTCLEKPVLIKGDLLLWKVR